MQLYVQFKLGSNITFIKLKENARIETCDAFMLLRIYFCDGCFIQMLKDSKNLLKMSLKILFIKRKRENSFHSSLPHIRPAGPSFYFFPRPSTAASSPARLPLFPARPSSRQPPNRAGPAARTVPAQPRRTRQLPRPAADARAPPVGAVPYPARLGNRPLLALQQPPPRRASWERPPRPSASLKRQPSPPCCPRSIFASFPAATAARRSPADHRPRRPRRSRLRAVTASDFRPW